ncbi:hypothetical protein HDU93_001249, partial [Gonapodya sp. JEL0774]
MMFNPRVVALQVLTDNEWRWVGPISGGMICNLGDTLQFITGNVLKSTQHRVMRPPGNHGDLERFNLIYFLRAKDDVPLKPVPSPLVDAERAGDSGMTAGEWVAKRVQATVKQVQYRGAKEQTGELENAADEYQKFQKIINKSQGASERQLYGK